jgi:GNAT superfamily N-acetyltransferase
VEIREAVPDDAEEISALIVSLADRFLADPDDRAAAEPFFAAHGPEALRRTLSDDRFRYRVAKEGGRLVGVVGVRDGSHLLHLFVAERHHRRGIAGRLWALAKAGALAAGNPGRFTVNSSLGALSFYERFGFVVAGEEVRKDGVAFVPMVLDERQA